MTNDARYSVYVGNAGTVHTGFSRLEAIKAFHCYVKLSTDNYGRVAGEPVFLFSGEEIIAEHNPE